jgi:hypothetical protein
MEENEKEKRDTSVETYYNTYGILNRRLKPYCEPFKILVNGKECWGIQENRMKFDKVLTMLVNPGLHDSWFCYFFFYEYFNPLIRN